VGVVTVSRVINGRPGVSEEMRTWVRSVIDRLQYVPKELDRRPGRKPKPGTIGATPRIIDLVIAYPFRLGDFAARAPIYARMLDALDEAAERQGLELYVRQGRCAAPKVQAGSLVGRMIFGMPENTDLVLDPPGTPTPPHVWIMGGDNGDFSGDSVRVDHARIGELAALTLHRRGHRHLAFLGTWMGYSDRPTGMRAEAFAWHATARGCTVTTVADPNLVNNRTGQNEPDEALLASSLDRCLAGNPRPTALFLELAVLAPALWRLLAERGLRPGIDVEVLVCNNDGIYLDRLQPRPLVIDIPCRAMADLAVDLLINRHLRTYVRPPTRFLVAPEVVPEKS
jgi:DNA-binding LacI/PurR family transcriptional regulator